MTNIKSAMIAVWAVLFSAFLGDTPASDRSPTSSSASAVTHSTKIILIGIAKIGEKRLIYLLDRESGETLELEGQNRHPSGLEVREVKETVHAMEGRVRVRKNGVEWWLGFAEATAVAAAIPVPHSQAITQKPAPVIIQRAPPRNPGTFSNDSLTVRPAADAKSPVNAR